MAGAFQFRMLRDALLRNAPQHEGREVWVAGYPTAHATLPGLAWPEPGIQRLAREGWVPGSRFARPANVGVGKVVIPDGKANAG